MLSTLVTSGGSLLCVAYIGCIKFLQEKKILDKINTFIGTSFGAIISFLLVIGFTWSEMLIALDEFIILQNKQEPNIENILNIYYALGIDNGDFVTAFLSKQVSKKLQVPDITFMELAKRTGKNLVVTACRMRDMKEVFFSVDSTPNLSVLKAVRASISLPVIFVPVTINDELYIDAGLIMNFPVSYVKENCLRDVLGLDIKTEVESSSNSNQTVTSKLKDWNIAKMLLTMIDQSIRKMNSMHHIPENVHIVKIPIGSVKALECNYDLNKLQFQIEKKDIEERVTLGYNTMQTYYTSSLESFH